ncbi:hypothetical protein chiPu_0014368 [Chiloscyllium punctatum]|uniref:Uncharacterized protein n=1 Tax=Chiloscyllium punctatum TaxID=137246 RepID=A0A401SZQ3_CHIPU|nr:hypothetical protein [Chiloscyllium punctatum]
MGPQVSAQEQSGNGDAYCCWDNRLRIGSQAVARGKESEDQVHRHLLGEDTGRIHRQLLGEHTGRIQRRLVVEKGEDEFTGLYLENGLRMGEQSVAQGKQTEWVYRL